ncbi:MAG: hypothetical protein MUQ61_00275 [OM182 bacterium]|jgi:hypothetical protein|nr:hypothetical protein [OM182 bacterium]
MVMLPPLPILLGYVLLSMLIAAIGRKRVVGFLGMFVLSLLFSPIIMGLVLLVMAPVSKAR